MQKQAFYFSNWRLFLGLIIIAPITAFTGFLSLAMLAEGQTKDDGMLFAIVLLVTLVLGFFLGVALLKIIRGNPYIIIEGASICLDPYTKSEARIHIDDILSINMKEVSLNKMIEIRLREEGQHFQQLSFFNKIRLGLNPVTGFTLYNVNTSMIRKSQREDFLLAIDQFIQQNEDFISPTAVFEDLKIVETQPQVTNKKEFIQKYDPEATVDKTIDGRYFLKAYGYGLFIFGLFFVLFYFMMNQNNNYLVYLIISFITFPFAKVLIDAMYGFTFRHKIDKQQGVTYYFSQLLFFHDVILFHTSLFLAPIGLLFLLIRLLIGRIQRK